MSHTKGPWRVEGRFRVVRDTDGPLPRIIVDSTISGECRDDENEADAANARLISAAPDLLEACKYTLSVLTGERCADPPEVEDMLREAIVKAEGSSPCEKS